MHKLLRNICLSAAVGMLLSACGSTGYGVAKIDSEPQGAEIINLKDNTHLGSTPATVSFTGDKGTPENITIELVKPGYKERITSFWINNRYEDETSATADAIDVKVELEQE